MAMHQHLFELKAMLIGALGTFVGFMFDVPWPTLWTAAFGAFIGLSFKPATSLKNGFCLVLFGACSIGLMVPFVTSHPPTVPEKSISFFMALIVIGGRNLLPLACQSILQAAIDRVVELIKGWGTKP
jgi:hypothetical protein